VKCYKGEEPRSAKDDQKSVERVQGRGGEGVRERGGEGVSACRRGSPRVGEGPQGQGREGRV
jgi:hypothetical protein